MTSWLGLAGAAVSVAHRGVAIVAVKDDGRRAAVEVI